MNTAMDIAEALEHEQIEALGQRFVQKIMAVPPRRGRTKRPTPARRAPKF